MRQQSIRMILACGFTLALVAVPLGAQDGRSPQEQALVKLAGELARLLKAADADANGTLSAAEFRVFAPTVAKAGEGILNGIDPSIAEKKSAKDLKKFDKNVDGTLDAEEKKAAAEDARLKEIKDFDWDKDGKLDEREQTAMQWAAEGKLNGVFRKIDTDANGQLSQEEAGAALSEISGIKVKKAKP